MYNVVVDYACSRIEPQLPTQVIVKLSDKLSYYQEGYRFARAFKLKKWDGKVRLFNMMDQSFRTGLLWRVCRVLSQENVEHKIHDLRVPKEHLKHLANIDVRVNPYEFQIEAAKSTTSCTHGIVASPTGTGKTVVLALIVKLHNTRTLIIENSRVLLDQTYEYFDSIIPGKVGIVGDGDFELNDVVVSTYQSLTSILGIGKKQEPTSKAPLLKEWLDGVGLLEIDETHEADTNGITGICALTKADRFIGTTATPYSWAHSSEKTANLPMEVNVGVKCYDSRDTVDFIKLGIIVPLYVVRPITPVVEKYKDYSPDDQISKESAGEFKDVVDNQIINNPERIKMLAERVKSYVSRGLSTYVYYNRIAYGEALLAAMSDMDPVMLQGSTPREERQRIFRDLESKKRLLVLSDIGTFGLNIKSLDCVVLAIGQRDARQLCGRACRASPGKTHGIIEDPVDIAPYLFHHANLRLKQYEKAGNIVLG